VAYAVLLTLAGNSHGAESYAHQSLSSRRFDGQDLRKASLQYSVISDASFVGAILSEADLSYTVASDANFASAKLDRADIDYAVASDASFEKADLRGAQMCYCVLTDANFRQADCRGASFAYSLLNSADFSGADLRGVRLREASLGGRFDGTTIYDEHTEFPPGFDPREHGLTLKSDAPPAPPAINEEPTLQPSARYDDRTRVRVKAIADLWPGQKGSNPGQMIVYRNALYFRGMSPDSGEALWRFDGLRTELAARLSLDTRRTYPQLLAVYGDKLYFAITPAPTRDRKRQPWLELWEFDGQAARPVPGVRATEQPSALEFRGKLYFTGYDEAFGEELWAFDGKTARRMTDINAGPRNSGCHRLVVFQDALYCFADDGLHGIELWRFDGQEATLVADIDSSPRSSRMNVYDAAVVFKDKLYFGADDGKNGKELWCWDGHEVRLAADVNPGTFPSFCMGLVVHGERLYFSANHLFRPENGSAYRPALWSFDGERPSLVATKGGEVLWQGVGVMGSWNSLLFFGVGGEPRDLQTCVLDGNVFSSVRSEPPSDALVDANLLVRWNGRAFGVADLPGKGYEPCEFVPQTSTSDVAAPDKPEQR